jgi:hypothetical protein
MSLFQLPHPSRSESKTGAQTDSLSRKRSPPPVGRLELLEWKEGSKGGMQALAWCACVPLLCGVWCVVCEASQEACCFDCLWVPPATILHASSTMAGAGGDNTESAH